MNDLRTSSWPVRQGRSPLQKTLTAVGLLLGVFAAIFLSAMFAMLVVLLALVMLVWQFVVARRLQRSPAGRRPGSMRA